MSAPLPPVDPSHSCVVCGRPAQSTEPTCRSCQATAEAMRDGSLATTLDLPQDPRARRAMPAATIPGFRIVRELGAGGMGVVYEAIDEKMNRRVALKILSRHIMSSEQAESRFAREAWIGGKLGHPNLVRVFERGASAEVNYYSMELLDGGSLADVIRRMKQQGRDDVWGLEFGGREYMAWAIGQVIAAARGLDHCHRNGVIHRDIKPMNLLLQKEPCALKIADFGLAVDMGATRMTTTGKVLGTVAYMAPEQIRGDSLAIGPGVDVYALGVTLFELLTLELPFTGSTQQLYLNAVLTSSARRPSKLNQRVGRDLEVVLGKALEKDPRHRYAGAGAFADDLESVLAFRPIQARPPTPWTRLAKWARRRPLHAALAGLLIVGVPTVAALSINAARASRQLAQVEVAELWRRSERLGQEGRYAEEAEALTRLLAIEADHPKALQARAICRSELAVLESRPERRAELQAQALEDISAVVSALPDEPWPYRVRAYLHRRAGASEEAAADEAEATRRRSGPPDDVEIDIDAELAMGERDHRRAADLLTRLIQLRPGSAQAIFRRARAFELLGEREKAIVDYRVAAALDPADYMSIFNLGILMTDLGQLSEGAANLERALTLDQGNARIQVELSRNLIEQAKAAAGGGNREAAGRLLEQAESAARRSLQLDPELPWAHLNLGLALVEQNRGSGENQPALLAEAIDRFRHVTASWEAAGKDAKAPVYEAALVNECDALIQARALSQALTSCARVAEVQPDNPNAHYNLAGAFALLGRRDDALRSLRKDVDLGDVDADYLSADAWFEGLRGDPRFKALLDRMKKGAAAR